MPLGPVLSNYKISVRVQICTLDNKSTDLCRKTCTFATFELYSYSGSFFDNFDKISSCLEYKISKLKSVFTSSKSTIIEYYKVVL